MLSNVNVAKFILAFHFMNDQGDQRKVEFSGGLIKMKDKRRLADSITNSDFISAQIQLDFIEFSHCRTIYL